MSSTSPPQLAGSSGGTLARFVSEAGAGVLAVATALALEAVGVALLHHAHLTGPWELRAALIGILPLAVVVALPLVVVSVAVARLIDGGRLSGRIGVVVLVGCGAGAFGYGVTFGRHFQQLALRAGFVAAVVVAAAAAAWWLVPMAARTWRRFPRGFALSCAVVTVGLEIVNQLVLPRLYPAFHVALSVLAVVLFAWVGRPLVDALSRRALLGAAGIVALLAIGASPYSLQALTSWDNVRLLYLTEAPTLAHALRLAAWWQPPERADAEMAVADGQEDRWVDWRDRDLLLLTVDALRADRVGSYGYARTTTPQIDALAARGVVFERAYTVMPHTSYAMTSLLTGKYIRPLLMQGTGQDSDTLPGLLRTYGYRTAAFYPPSLFAVDEERFAWAKATGLDFEYRKLEYAEAALRTDQVVDYLDTVAGDHRFFLWAHFFEPHEPYAPPAGFDFGPRATDRYDGEIAAVDAVLGQLVSTVLARRPDTVVIITADHGEAFGEHGSYYHGTTVYEEQVRVPLIVVARDLAPRRVPVPVQLIDLMPTILRAMDVPRRPRVRGIDLGAWMTGRGQGDGFAFSETHDQMLLAEGAWRLVCERKIDACSLFDLDHDPQQLRDASVHEPERFSRMRQRLRTVEASHGTYERAGSRAEGKDLPAPLIRGMAGDADAAQDVAGLLDDADVVIRRKAGEVLFQLARKETAPALGLAVSRDEDVEVKRWCALALTRLGHGAPLTLELLQQEDASWKRLAALALAESGDGRGEAVLMEWWGSEDPSVERRKEIAKALAKVGAKTAVVPLTRWLDNEQLRPTLAVALADIKDPYARIPLLRFFSEERYLHARLVLARSLVALGASREMAPPLARFLGVPDPLEGGVGVALEAKILDALGGPDDKALVRLAKAGPEGADFRIVVPKGGNGKGFRVILRAKAQGAGASVRFGRVEGGARLPRLDPKATVTLEVPPGQASEVHASLGEGFGASGGAPLHVMLVPDRGLVLEGFVVVPLADEIPPPAPKPWNPDGEGL